MSTSEPEQVWEFFQRKRDGVFVEVGANDPRHGSQTWLLEQMGWTGVLIEPQSRHYRRLCADRPGARVFATACSAPGHPPEAVLHLARSDGQSGLSPTQFEATYVETEIVPVSTLNEVLRVAEIVKIDFVSIDVEGHQVEVLCGFDLDYYRPALLLVEDRFRNWRTHFYLRKHGYRFIRRSGGLNSWYIRKENSFRVRLLEYLRLFRFVWLGTPVRAAKFWWRERRSKLQFSMSDPVPHSGWVLVEKGKEINAGDYVYARHEKKWFLVEEGDEKTKQKVVGWVCRPAGRDKTEEINVDE